MGRAGHPPGDGAGEVVKTPGGALTGIVLSISVLTHPIDGAAAVATEGARVLAQNAYKVDLAQGVVREALQRLLT